MKTMSTDISVNINRKRIVLAASLFIALAWLVLPLAVHPQGTPSAADAPPKKNPRLQATFASPQDAVDALVAGVRAGDWNRVREVLGPGAGRVIRSGDPAEDERARQQFLAAYDKQARIETVSDKRAILHIGEQDWPFAFPIVKTDTAWRIDTKAGLQAFLDRRIGENELSAIQVCLAYVDAQREYVLKDRTRDGLLEYAQRIVSSEGQHDGLYWPTEEGAPPSPMGAAFARANREAFRGSEDAPEPYKGYFFRILTGQGPHADGGPADYLVKGHMIGGFALVAYPARYRVSGIMTFIVNHEGIVFSKDLRAGTVATAERMTRFDPDASWKRETQ
jgi:Protein of unknown function (DUF2950)